MSRMLIVAAVTLWGALCGCGLTAAHAQAPVAVVEDVDSKTAGVEFMDYVSAGKTIKLGPSDTLVLSYMHSCWRETISGGTVAVGTDQSTVTGGKVRREKVPCDGGKMQLTQQQASKSGAVVFRNAPKVNTNQPQLILYGLSPVVDVKGGGHLIIERIDQPGERIEMDIAAHQLVRGTFYDFAKAGKALTPGGTYRASAGTDHITFKVDPNAAPGQAPILSRLLRLRPAA